MKVLQIIKKIIIGAVLIVFFTFAIAMTILMLNVNKYGLTQFNTTTIIPIRENITSEKYKKGDLVTVEKHPIDQIRAGDELFVYRVKTDGSVQIDFGIVGQTYKEDSVLEFENGSAFHIDYVVGSVDKVYNGFGTVYSIVQSKWGFLFIVLVPSFLIFVYEIFALVIEIKYGKDEKEKPI